MSKKRLVGPHYPIEVEEEIDDYSAKLVTTLEDSGAYTGSAVEWHPHAAIHPVPRGGGTERL